MRLSYQLTCILKMLFESFWRIFNDTLSYFDSRYPSSKKGVNIIIIAEQLIESIDGNRKSRADWV